MTDYYEKLVDNQLSRLSGITPSASSTNRALELALKAIQDNCPTSKSSAILSNPIFRLAAAAAIIVAVCLGIILLNSKTNTTPNKQIVNPDNNNSNITVTKNDHVNQHDIKFQLAELQKMYNAGDIDGLIEKLTEDDLTLAAAAAAHLAKTDDLRAIEPLRTLAKKWQGDGPNPFEKAIEDIQANADSNDNLHLNNTSGQNDPNTLAAPNAKKEYVSPQNIHRTFTGIKDDGTESKRQTWIKLPNFYKSESDSHIVIDNGTDRLTINHINKIAQFEDSRQDHEPLSEHYLFRQSKNILKNPSNIKKPVLNDRLGTADTLVYDFQKHYYGNGIKRTKNCKAWIEADTLRLSTFKSQYPEFDPDEISYRSETETFDYSAIPDSVFEMKVPPGYEIPPRIQRPTFTGIVVDQKGNPMPGIKVCMQYSYDHSKTLNTYTDKQGFFTLKASPLQHSYLISRGNLMFFWAYPEDDPDWVAWTLFPKDPKFEDYPYGGPIPGHIEKINEVFSHGSNRCIGMTGIVLEMEKAVKIHGRITDSLGRGVPSAEILTSAGLLGVSKVNPDSKTINDYTWTSKTHTDEEGYYLAGNLPRLWKGSTRNMYISAKGCNSKSHYVTGEFENDQKKVDIELLMTGITISGTVVDNYGKLLPNRYVIISCGKGNSVKAVTTDEKGRFVAKDCPITANIKVTAELKRQPMNFKEIVTYQFYKDVSKEIVLEENELDYEIELVAQIPDNVFEVQVVDSSGQPMPYFPVCIMFDDNISHAWSQYKLLKRTGINGLCTIAGVPSVEQVTIWLKGDNKLPFDNALDKETKKLVEDLRKEYSEFSSKRIKVELTEDKKKYKIRAEMLTPKEKRERKQNRTR